MAWHAICIWNAFILSRPHIKLLSTAVQQQLYTLKDRLMLVIKVEKRRGLRFSFEDACFNENYYFKPASH